MRDARLAHAASTTTRHGTRRLRVQPRTRSAIAPHFVERVPRARRRRSGRGAIETTLDAPLQRTVQGIIAAQPRRARAASRVERRGRRARQPHRRMAGVGRIGQLLRSASTAARSTASTSPRQPGSALKPFTYAAAFERGYHPGRVARRRAVAVSDRRPRRACTARGTTTDSSAGRCWCGRRSRDRRTSRPSRSRPRSACRPCCACCGGRASRRSTATPRTTVSGSRSATPKCGSTRWWRPTR